MALIDTIKGYFETGDVPTQSQFYQFFEGIFFKDTGLGTEGTLAAAGTIAIPAKGKLQSIVFWTASNQWVKVGDSAGADDYIDQELTAGVPFELDIAKFSIAGQTIHLTGENVATINYKYYLK